MSRLSPTATASSAVQPSREPALVSVVFSFRNEESNIPLLVARVAKALDGQAPDYEMIFVNDASTDASLTVLEHEHAANPRVKALTLSRRFGVAEGVLAGMAASSGDVIVYMDADLQDPPELIPRMLDRWRQGADVVHTVRIRRHGENRGKMWMTRLAYRVIQFGSTIDLPVDAGDFKLLSRHAVQHLLALRESDPYLRGLAVWIGFTQAFVPYEREARHAGRTHFPVFSRNPWKTFVLGLTSFSFMPIYAFGVLAALGLALSVVLAVTAGLLWADDAAAARVAGLVALVTFFWATTIGAVSAVGLYVARAYKDGRGRPPYIVASTLGLPRPGHAAMETHQ